VFIGEGVWTSSRWIRLTPGDGTRSWSGRNDLLPLGHKWEHGHGLPVLGRSGVAILLLCWGGSCQCARAVVVQQQIRHSNKINNKSPMRVTLFVHRESDLSSFRMMIRW
jgi:hypothetical protein